ncbi:MAG: TGS domain-containing protein, partial [Planctomycetes bacterium]|nr:TGS domain-containing protein [Planctomycetota bacterium]
VTDQVEICLDFLHERTLILPEDATEKDSELYRHMVRPCLWVASKADLAGVGDFEVLRDMVQNNLTMTCASMEDPESIDKLSLIIFETLKIVRIYSKIPGKPLDKKDPFILPAGSTVFDLAIKVHRELAEKLRYARGWGEDKYDGQNVPRDYALRDKDIIELHFS